jgi:hypothetical protein
VTNEPPKAQLSFVPALILLVTRGFLLWFVIPAAIAVYVLSFARSRGTSSLGQYLGWVDLNLIALIERTVLRPVVREPMSWTPRKEIRTVTHRIGIFDPL